MADLQPRALASEPVSRGKLLGGFIGLLWLIQIVNALIFHGALFNLGIHPRTLFGLLGILFAPFLHASFAHLIANTIPLAVLGWFVMMRSRRHFFAVSALTALVGGLGTWLVAPALSVHAGASVLVFGYLGYLLSRGVFERRFWPIVGGIVAFFLYGGALWGVLPGALGVSWQAHFFGLLGGVLSARLFAGGAPALPAPAAPVRQRVEPREDRARRRLPQSDAESDDDIEAELVRAKERLRARES